jgi:hypothetical protein
MLARLAEEGDVKARRVLALADLGAMGEDGLVLNAMEAPWPMPALLRGRSNPTWMRKDQAPSPASGWRRRT